MQVRRWAEQVLLCKANRTDWNATEHKRAWSGMGEGTRAFCFLGDGVTAEVLLISAQRKAFLSQVPLPCLPSSLLFTLEDQTFGTVHRREMFTTELCPALTHPPTMTSNTLTPSLVKTSFTILLSSTPQLSLFSTMSSTAEVQTLTVGPTLRRSKGDQEPRQKTAG